MCLDTVKPLALGETTCAPSCAFGLRPAATSSPPWSYVLVTCPHCRQEQTHAMPPGSGWFSVACAGCGELVIEVQRGRRLVTP